MPLRARVTDDIVAGAVECNMGGGIPVGPEAWRWWNANELTDITNLDEISGFPVYKALFCEVARLEAGTAPHGRIRQALLDPRGNEAVLYMALELSNAKCGLAFGDGTRQRQVVIAAGDVASLSEQIAQVKAKWGLSPETPVVSYYEAGWDGFWLHRQLVALGIARQVVDAASIEVSRRAGRPKTDRLDAWALLEKLIRYAGGERGVWRVVRVPDAAWEDLR